MISSLGPRGMSIKSATREPRRFCPRCYGKRPKTELIALTTTLDSTKQIMQTARYRCGHSSRQRFGHPLGARTFALIERQLYGHLKGLPITMRST